MTLKLINPKHYFNEFKQFSKFVIKPFSNSTNDLTLAKKMEGTWTMFVVKMILAIIVGIAIGLIYDPENRTTSDMMERFSPFVLLIVMVFVLPLLEEIAFRLSLKFSPLFLSFSLAVIGYYIASKIIFQTKLSDVDHNFDVRIMIVFIIILITYPLFSIPKVKSVLTLFWENNFRWILYFFCFGFASMHIFNYELSLEHLLLMPIITLPKLINALCYGYVRINYGFIYAFAIHMCTNGIGFSVNMLSRSN